MSIERGRSSTPERRHSLGETLRSLARSISPFPIEDQVSTQKATKDDEMVQLPSRNSTPVSTPTSERPQSHHSLGERLSAALSSREQSPDAVTPTSRRKSWVELGTDALGTLTRSIVDSIPGLDTLAIDFKNEELMRRTKKKFLDAYTEEDIAQFLKEFGIKEDLRAQGFNNIIFKIDLSDDFVHRLTVTDETLFDVESHGPLRDDQFICDCFIRHKSMLYHDLHAYQEMARLADPQGRIALVEKRDHYVGLRDISIEEASHLRDFLMNHFETPLQVTHIEWISLQNPRIPFQDNRPPLPGQKYPGLRAAKKVMILFEEVAKRKGKDALSNTPDHFHNAFIYQARGWRYVNPAYEGFFSALVDDLSANLLTLGLAPVAWAFFLGHVRRRLDKNDPTKTEQVLWSSMDEQLYSTSDRMTKYFESKEYQQLRESYKQRYLGQFFIDWEKAKPDAELAIAARAKSPQILPTNRARECVPPLSLQN